MVAWEEAYRQASFKNVEFDGAVPSRVSGRRLVVFAYPGRDEHEVDDNGRKHPSFRVSARVQGDNWQEKADELERACESEGPGIFVHPFIGRVMVHCDSCERKSSPEELRMARFMMRFVKSAIEPPRVDEESTSTSTDTVSEELDLEAVAEATDRVVVDGPEFLREAVSDTLSEISSLMNTLDVLSGPIQDVARFQTQITGLINRGAELAASPALMATSVIEAVRSIQDAAGNFVGALSAYERLFELFADAPVAQDPLSIQAANNAQTVIATMQYGAVGGIARMAVRSTFPSFEEALEARERLVELIDSTLETASGTTYPLVQELMALLVRGVPRSDGSLPRLGVFRVRRTTPVQVLSWRLYGTPDLDEDIVARNRIRHPLFSPTGDLQVLS